MSDFDILRIALRDARAQQESDADAVAAARQRVLRLQNRAAALERTLKPGDAAGAQQLQAIKTAITQAEGTLAASQGVLQDARAAAVQALAGFELFSDPRTAVGEMPAATPFLLFPLRLETRFMPGAGGPELCVRVYPDDALVDTFEPTLTDAEVRSARAYWTGIWQAGGVTDQRRGAWRELVASHGSGRAAWIIDHYAPLNAATEPVKAKETDVVLAIPVETAPTAAQTAALKPFWEALWRADGNPQAEQAARDALAAIPGAPTPQVAMAAHRPANLAERPAPPLKKADVQVKVEWVVFPPADAVETRAQSWSRTPRVSAFPDRLVLMAYAGPNDANPLVKVGRPIPLPLAVGPDPYATGAEQLQPDAGGLAVPDEMLWMTDFTRAVQVGMGFRVKLNATQAKAGFQRLLVLGVRSTETAEEGRQTLETLLAHHRDGRSGLALVPQGTPTNNTEGTASGFSRTDDADASFDQRFGTVPPDPLAAALPSWLARTDGDWLAAMLGIDPAVLQDVPNARGTDQAEARAMNTALWPGTLGYWMDTMMGDAFAEADVEHARRFVTRYVSGRGAVPAVRIGRQPYGIVTATAYSRIAWELEQGIAGPPKSGTAAFLRRLYAFLRLAHEDWKEMADGVSYVGRKNADPHTTLLDVVGLHPDSAEYALRWAESMEQVHNLLALHGQLADFSDVDERLEAAFALLARYGYTDEVPPDLLYRFFFSTPDDLNGPVVDDVPVSETKPVREYTADKRNYVQWLIDAAETSLDTLRREQGFTGNKPPRALLYLLLRYALETGYHETGRRLYLDAQLLSDDDARLTRREPPFINVAVEAARSESRYGLLYGVEPAITSHPSMTVADYVSPRIASLLPARPLHEQLQALERLKDRPTARLERALAEHVDCCAYRYDAWMLGLVHYLLAGQRGVRDGDAGPPAKGIHLGAYGWLHDVRPEPRELTVPVLTEKLAEVFHPGEDPPLRADSANQGYIHAPSLNHAVTAAVLRNGYRANATSANPRTLEVNLTSERVRTALGMLEGMRAGQSLGALLGYRLERGLHDHHPGVELDSFLWELRREFPLGGNRMESTRDPAEAAEKVDARNVVDGLALVRHVRSLPEAQRKYKWGRNLPDAGAAQAAAIDAEVSGLMDAHDAIADLAIAEGVHQAVQGNYDRVAGTLDAYGKGGLPPEPEVVRTPATGTGLTHRVAVHLDAAAASAPGTTPRAAAEPALNAWLATVLPPPGSVGCVAHFRAAATDAETPVTVTLADLGLQPVDVLYLVRDESRQAMTELDDRVVRHVATTHALRPAGGVRIRFMERGAAAISVFELMPLARSLRRIAFASRPLRPSDLSLAGEAREAQDRAATLDRARVADARTALEDARDDAAGLAELRGRVAGPAPVDLEARRASLLADIDAYLSDAAARLARLARFGMTQAGWGFVHRWPGDHAGTVLAKAAALVVRWDARLNEHEDRVDDAADVTLPDDARFELLLRAERLVSTTLTVALPPDPATFAAAVAVKKAAFVARRNEFAAVLAAPPPAAKALLDAVRLDTTPFDPVEWTLREDEDRVVAFARELLGVLDAAAAEVERRITAAQAALDRHDATTSAEDRVAALQAGAKAVFGEEFVLVPRFTLPADPAAELASAFAAGSLAGAGGLLHHLESVEGVDFPVDEWMYGVARVRDKVRAWEETVMLAGGFGVAEPALTPMQLPFRAGDSWLGLQFPAGYALDGERLLYTAHAPGFDPTQPLCGLLLDEWTEVIPGDQATTGIAFHYDRPNSEPPQAMLLVTPPQPRQGWLWADLVDAVHETMELARLRAVEPKQVDESEYAPFLPATTMAVTASPLTIIANLARNNDYAAFLTTDD